MPAKPTIEKPRDLTVALALALCTVVAVVSCLAAAWLFKREPMPFEHFAVVGACTADAHWAERPDCAQRSAVSPATVRQ